MCFPMSIVSPSDFHYSLMNHCYLIGFMVAFLLVSSGCDSGTAPSLYDPDRSSLSDPTIDTVSPEGSALAGVDVITITGSNFSTQPTDNLVYFGTDRANVLESTATQLQVFAPNSPQPELQLRMSVVGAENFSNSVAYGLDAPFIEFGDVKDFEDIYGIATDDDGNLYASLVAFNLAVGIIKITPEGERSDYITSTFPWTDIEFGSDNALFAVRSVRALFSAPKDGTNFAVFAVIPNSTTRLNSIAIDYNDRVWTSGINADIYRVDPDKSIHTFDFEPNVRDLVLFGDHLYVAGVQDDKGMIWRFPMDATGNLGMAEDFHDFGSSDVTPYALAFSADGHLYVGVDDTDPVLLIKPDGDDDVLYPDVITQPARQFAWGIEDQLFAATNSSDTLSSGIIRIKTRRIGNR